MSADISLRLTAAMRAADSRFETVGGSTRHFVNDCLLPALEAGRLAVVDALVPQHLKSAERDVGSLGRKLDAADRLVDDLLEALHITSNCSPVTKDLEAMHDDAEVKLTFTAADLKQIRAAIAAAKGGAR